MECPNCGQENRDVALFCQHCGTPLAIAEPSPGEPGETTEPDEAATKEQEAPSPEESEEIQRQGPTPEAAALNTEPAEDKGPVVAPEDQEEGSEPGQLTLEQEPQPIEPAAAPDVGSEPPVTSEEVPDQVPEQKAPELPPDTPEPVSERPSDMEPPEPEKEVGPELEEELEPVAETDAPAEAQETHLPSPSTFDQGWLDIGELADAHLLPWSDEPSPLEALELGTVLNGRYQVIEVTETKPTYIQYRVRDLERCPRCGTAGHSPDEAFCRSCGALMDQKPVATMRQQPASSDAPLTEVEPEEQFTENEQSYWVWRETREGDAMQDEKPLMRLLVGLQSDTGQVRELDEDSMLVLTMAVTYESVTHQLGLFVVADGMGGHEGGEVASRVAIQITAQKLMRDLFGPELAGKPLSEKAILEKLANAIRQANDEVYLERQKRENDMGTTLTAAFVRDWTLHLGHVGDCRAYRWGQEGLEQLTTDHSIVAGMVAAGTITAEEIYTHPQRSVIYRCVGDQPTVEVDVDTVQLYPGERLLVCCDGLWEELRDAGIEEILLAEADPQTACDRMVHQANLAGGSDNISVILVQL